MAVIRTICANLVLVFLLSISGGHCKMDHHPKSKQIATFAKKNLQSIEYITKPKDGIVIPIMIHLDKAMTSQMPKLPGSKRIKFKPKRILQEVEKIFNAGILHQKVRLKLVNLRVITNSTGVAIDENVSRYLKSYCNWQMKKKIENNQWYYSVLLTGLDLYYINVDGRKVEESTGRGYMSKMCSVDKSCTVMRWHSRDVVYLLAHEIAHSLGVYHDGLSNECPKHGFIMSSQYDQYNPPKFWSPCSRAHLNKFLKNKSKSWCVQHYIDPQ